MNKAFFLDRDGVINVDGDYLHRPEDVVLIPGTAEAVNRIHAAGYLAVVVSNQSGVARGMFTMDAVKSVEKRIGELLAEQGAALDAFYYCPHHRNGIVPELKCECSCRKPKPGMILQAAKDLDIDISQSFLIGDQLTDLAAADAAGCAAAVMVQTGYGMKNTPEAMKEGRIVRPSIAEAVEYLLKK